MVRKTIAAQGLFPFLVYSTACAKCRVLDSEPRWRWFEEGAEHSAGEPAGRNTPLELC